MEWGPAGRVRQRASIPHLKCNHNGIQVLVDRDKVLHLARYYTLLAPLAGQQLEFVREESGALLGSHAIAREFLTVDLTLDRLSGDWWRRLTIWREVPVTKLRLEDAV